MIKWAGYPKSKIRIPNSKMYCYSSNTFFYTKRNEIKTIGLRKIVGDMAEIGLYLIIGDQCLEIRHVPQAPFGNENKLLTDFTHDIQVDRFVRMQANDCLRV